MIDKQGCIINKMTKQSYTIEIGEYWICYTKDKYIIAWPWSVIRNEENLIYPGNLSLDHLEWTYKKHTDAMSAIIEIKNKLYFKKNTLLKRYEYHRIMEHHKLYTNVLSLFSLCAIKMYEDIQKNGMVKINYPISEPTLVRIFPNITYGWWAKKYSSDYLFKYSSINKILYVNFVTSNKLSYIDNPDYIYLGICITYLDRFPVRGMFHSIHQNIES